MLLIMVLGLLADHEALKPKICVLKLMILMQGECANKAHQVPPGYASWVSLHSRTQGLNFVSEVSEEAEGWVDALHIASYAAKQGCMQMLGKAAAGHYHPALILKISGISTEEEARPNL